MFMGLENNTSCIMIDLHATHLTDAAATMMLRLLNTTPYIIHIDFSFNQLSEHVKNDINSMFPKKKRETIIKYYEREKYGIF